MRCDEAFKVEIALLRRLAWRLPVNRISLILLWLLILIGAPLAHAQNPSTEARRPGVWIEPQPDLKPIRLSALDIHVRVRGFISRTTLDLTFSNPNARVLEGEFVFPLAAGQTIAGYALEVNGELREGVVVDKKTARVAFEQITRRQIDPGLAELTAGNVFRTRLYPIPANGVKRVRLHVEAVLQDVGQEWRYRLPLHFAAPVDQLHVKAETLLNESQPLIDEVAGDPQLKFERAGVSWVAELTRTNVRPQKELAFRIPKQTDAQNTLVEAADPLDPAWRSVVAQVETGSPRNVAAPAPPTRIVLFFDASGSARDRDLVREKAALGAYVSTLKSSEVLLIAFRNEADPAQSFKIRNGNAAALMAALDALALDGGSSYGAIDLKLLGAVDQILIFGDGLSNFAGSQANLRTPDGRQPPVFVLHAAQRADHTRLAQLARQGGGQIIDLTTTTAGDAVKLLQQRPWRLLGSKVTGGECTQASPPDATRAEAVITVYARCRGKSQWTLSFGNGQGDETRRVLNIGSADSVTGGLADSVHRLWAQSWIDQLNAASAPDTAVISTLAKRYSVVTSSTSLLVLDRIEDYVQYRVEPKEAALKAEYLRMLAKQPKDVADLGLAARLDSLAQRWHEFRDYHAANYPGIETAIAPMATAELSAWGNASDKAWAAGRLEAQALKTGAEELSRRWLRDGAEPDSRATWEREAARMVFALEALRARREKLPAATVNIAQTLEIANEMEADESRTERSRPESAPAMAMPAPAPPASEAPFAMADSAAYEAVASADAPVGGAAAGPSDDARRQDGDSGASESPAMKASIELAGWNPDTPYLKAIRAAQDPYIEYLAQRENFGKTPSFYLDVADFLRGDARLPRLGLRVLSNLAELDTENTALTRVLAYRLGQWELYALAVPQFESALAQRPEEPQSYRDLALALARAPQAQPARAVDLLWQVATGSWDGRFPDVELIALHELNDVLAHAGDGAKIDLKSLGLDARFLDPVAVGLRVVLSWDADNTDIDLWVVDPSGEKAVFSNPRTRYGGRLSRDFTGGYGPEVFTVRRPLPGTYVVHANYFGDRRQSLTGPVTLQLEFQTRFGNADGKRVSVTRRVEGGSETLEIGRFKVGE